MDGFITIGTKLNTDKFDKQLADLQRKIEEQETKQMNIEADIEVKGQGIEKLQELINSAPAELDRLVAEIKEVEASMETMTPETGEYDIANQKLMELKIQAETYMEIMRQGPGVIEKQNLEIENLKIKQQQAADKADEYKQKVESINIQKQRAEVDKLKNSFHGVTNSVQGFANKLGRIALSMVGIYSGLAMLRRASSELANYDKQYAANLEYIRFALAQAIAPVLRYVVELAAKLLSYINAIASAWFGINLFANASVDSFKKMKSGASGVGKAVKEIKKQLLGFDEINRLTNTDSGTSAGAGGVGMAIPDFDLSNLNYEPPEWLKWIIDHKDEILGFFAGVLGFLGALKLGLGFITGLGIGIMIAGIVYAIEKMLKFLKDPTFENLGDTLIGIGYALEGLGLTTGNVAFAIAGAILLVAGQFTRNWETIKTKLQEGINWLKGKSDWIGKYLGRNVQELYLIVVGCLQNALNVLKGVMEGFRMSAYGVITFIKGVFTGDWKTAWEGIRIWSGGHAKQFETIWNGMLTSVNQLFLEPIKTNFTTTWNIVKIRAEEAWKGIQTTFSNVGNFFERTFSEAWGRVKRVFSTDGIFSPSIRDNIVNSFKRVVNSLISGLNRVIVQPFNQLNNVLNTLRNFSIANIKPFGSIGHINVPQIPYVKTGAIVNMPNKGTLVGGRAFAGESGREGVVPLTDKQAMSQLGAEIGKNVIINLTNVTQMNGRQINRELKRIQNDQVFAYNM